MTGPFTRLVDTNLLSKMMRPRPEPRVAAFLDSISDEGLDLAAVTVLGRCSTVSSDSTPAGDSRA